MVHAEQILSLIPTPKGSSKQWLPFVPAKVGLDARVEVVIACPENQTIVFIEPSDEYLAQHEALRFSLLTADIGAVIQLVGINPQNPDILLSLAEIGMQSGHSMAGMTPIQLTQRAIQIIERCCFPLETNALVYPRFKMPY